MLASWNSIKAIHQSYKIKEKKHIITSTVVEKTIKIQHSFMILKILRIGIEGSSLNLIQDFSEKTMFLMMIMMIYWVLLSEGWKQDKDIGSPEQ